MKDFEFLLKEIRRIFLGVEKESNEPKDPKEKRNLKKLLIIPVVIICFIILFSLAYTVEETEQAIVLTMGKVTKLETAGLHFKLPYPIQTVKRLEVNKTQKMQIGYTAKNEKDAGPLNSTSEAKMITGDLNIVNVDFFIEWKISDPVKYAFNSDEPIIILKNIAQASARSIIGSNKVDGVLTTEKSIIQAEIKVKMLDKLTNYDLGIQVLDVKIQDSEPPTNQVRDAFKAVETAKQEKETYINSAMAYQNEKIPLAQSEADKWIRDAEAYKETRVNEATGQVAKFNEMYTEYAKNRTITKTRMYLEVIEKILPGIPVYIDTTSNGIQKMLPIKEFVNVKEGGN